MTSNADRPPRRDQEAPGRPGMTVAPFTRVINPGSVALPWRTSRPLAPLFAKIEWDGTRLSISGVVGPTANGDAAGGCGQIRGERIAVYTPGWNDALYHRFNAAWLEWHLNDMQSACEHQRSLGWTYDTHSGQDCPVCGYRIGSAWLTKPVPDDVLEFLGTLPISLKTPAWV